MMRCGVVDIFLYFFDGWGRGRKGNRRLYSFFLFFSFLRFVLLVNSLKGFFSPPLLINMYISIYLVNLTIVIVTTSKISKFFDFLRWFFWCWFWEQNLTSPNKKFMDLLR